MNIIIENGKKFDKFQKFKEKINEVNAQDAKSAENKGADFFLTKPQTLNEMF